MFKKALALQFKAYTACTGWTIKFSRMWIQMLGIKELTKKLLKSLKALGGK